MRDRGGKQSEKLTQLSKKQGNARENKAEQGWATAVRMKDRGQREGEGGEEVGPENKSAEYNNRGKGGYHV